MDACPDDDTLSALLAGELAAPARESVAIHAAGCDVCRAVLACVVPTAIGSAADVDIDELGTALDLPPGARLGRYVIERRLGAGGMGVVYAARDPELERRVALKLLGAGHDDRAARARLIREARALARLDHPDVVTVFDVGEHQGHVFLAMELVDGGNLATWLAERPRRLDEILDCMIAAARGLAAAHRAGLVHRDVKPANILVGRDGRVRVTDFGLARVLAGAEAPVEDTGDRGETVGDAALTRTGAVLGTPLYMAPEALTGRADARSDQWAFCATLHELIAGVRPFPAEARARAEAIAAGRPSPPVGGRRVPRRLRRLIARGLRADPAARWPDLAAVIDELGRVRHRRRTHAIAAGGVALVGAAGVAIALGRPGAAPPREPPMTSPDGREGCHCPYSACDGGCLSVCAAPSYHRGAAALGISVAGRQESLQGASADGDTLLFVAGHRCAKDHLWLARRRGWLYVPVDLTPQLRAAGLAPFEGCCTLSADGRELVATTPDRQRFVGFALTGDRLGPPSTLFEQAPATGAGLLVTPVLAHDRLTLYYGVYDATADGDIGARQGAYLATRADPRQPFGPGRRIPGYARGLGFVSGISRDGLSLFMRRDYRTHVLVRARTDQWFAAPAYSVLPAQLDGWYAVPLADCRRVVVTWSPGGCEQEDIRFLDAD